VQEKITEADASTIRLDATLSRLSMPLPPTSPSFLCQMPFLSQLSQFILAWKTHQVSWVAYPAACTDDLDMILTMSLILSVGRLAELLENTRLSYVPTETKIDRGNGLAE